MHVIQRKNLSVLLLFFAAASVLLTGQTFTTLHNFTGTGGDGADPCCGLVQGLDGKFYGMTAGGGLPGAATIFKITPSGAIKQYPQPSPDTIIVDGATLLVGTDGNFYGSSFSGTQQGTGSVFRMTSTGKVTEFADLCPNGSGCPNGQQPSPLVQGRDGNFYGAANQGGTTAECYNFVQVGCGTIFRVTPSGVVTALYNFSNSGGSYPVGGLVQGTDGNFYGTTTSGTVFKITPSGTLTTLYTFCSKANCADGNYPNTTLVLGPDGNFYGTTLSGGDISCNPQFNNGCGTIFKITPAGKLTTLHVFHGNWSAGVAPFGLLQGTDGNFYGGTVKGGDPSSCDSEGCGTLFKMTPGGKFTTLHTFENTGGYNPVELVQGTDGNFYGTTTYGSSGGTGGSGTVFSLSVGLKPFVRTVPTAGKMGQLVRILGTDLTGTTSVTFHGVPIEFKIISPTQIQTQVPCDATTGKIEVVTPRGTLSSNVPFQIF